MSLSMRAILRKPANTAYLVEHYPTATPEQIADMTRRWKVTGDAIRQYAAVIGIKRDREAARAAYAEGAKAAAENAIPWAPPAPDRDDEYVAACLAEGGFGRYLETRGARGVVRLTGPYVPYAAERNAMRSQVAA